MSTRPRKPRGRARSSLCAGRPVSEGIYAARTCYSFFILDHTISFLRRDHGHKSSRARASARDHGACVVPARGPRPCPPYTKSMFYVKRHDSTTPSSRVELMEVDDKVTFRKATCAVNICLKYRAKSFLFARFFSRRNYYNNSNNNHNNMCMYNIIMISCPRARVMPSVHGGGVRTRYYATEEEIEDGGARSVMGKRGITARTPANTGLLRHGRRALPPTRSAGRRESWFRGVGRET